MSRQDDWLIYLQDSDAFDKYHFGPLITDTDEPVDLEAAFGALPNGIELIRRIREIQAENSFTGLYFVPSAENTLARPEMVELARQYAGSVAERLVALQLFDDAARLSANPVEFIDRGVFEQRFQERSLALLDVSIVIADDFIDHLSAFPNYVHGLDEAVLFMTKSPEVTRYVVSGMVEYPVTEKYAYDLWKAGAIVEFAEAQTYVVIGDE